MKTKFAKRLVSSALAAVMLLGISPTLSFGESNPLSPRSMVKICDDGYVHGFEGAVTADFVLSQFATGATVKSFGGAVLQGNDAVGSDSTVTVGGTSAKILIPADVNRDGKINLADVSALMKNIARWESDICEIAGDVTDDGKLTLQDTSAVMKYIAKWDVSFSEALTVDVTEDGEMLYTVSAGALNDRAAALISERSGYSVSFGNADSGKAIVIGRDLENTYSFIDSAAANAVAADRAYVDIYDGDIYITYNTDAGEKCALECAAAIPNADIPLGYVGDAGYLIWSGASNRLIETEIDHENKDYMNADILLALEYADFVAPKNIIYMIGDGMGRNIIEATQAKYGDKFYNGITAMNYLPNRANQSTYSADSNVTDSAAGGTALATGRKTNNGTLAMYGEEKFKTVLELAAENGKDTGIVVTHAVTDATPAAFTSHIHSRGEGISIAFQQLTKVQDGSLDIIMGGGLSDYKSIGNAKKIELVKEETGMTFVNDRRHWDEVLAADPDAPLIGLFATENMDMMLKGMPSLAEMTDVALTRLSRDPDGFFLMVEGSSIDSYAHNNNFDHQVYDCYDFDCAVAVAMRFAALNPDTVIIVTADHETGCLSIPAYPTAENIDGGYSYGSGDHTGIDVPLLGVGYRTEEFVGKINENVDVGIFVASLISDEEFGIKSTLHELADMTDSATANAVIESGCGNVEISEGGITVTFDEDHTYMCLLADDFATPTTEVNNSRAIHVTMTNKGDEPIRAPRLSLTQEGEDYFAVFQHEWILPGEEVCVAYALPAEIWWDLFFEDTEDLLLSYGNKSKAVIEISSIVVANRKVEH